MFISSTRALVEVGTLYPWGQHISWNSWHVLEGALTPAISSVRETIFLLILNIQDLTREDTGLLVSCHHHHHHHLPDIWVMIVGNILHGEDLAVLLGLLVFWPERGV